MSFEGLIKQVYEISKRYKEIARITGSNFNIFRTLDVQKDELSHSRVIKMLLDPHGDHGQGNTFLKLFLQKIKVFDEDFGENELNNIKIYREYSTRFGRLDIYICNNFLSIGIENKIFAADQDSQIERYTKYLLEGTGSRKKIIYLTLDGREPQSLGNLSDKEKEELLLCISYKDDILDWLELCHKECHNFPVVHETLTQYINIVKTLTGQSWSRQMNAEIIELLSNSDNIQSAFAIGRLFSNFELQKHLLENNFWCPLKSALEKNHGLKCHVGSYSSIGKPWYGFSFKKEGWKKIHIRLEFEGPAGTFTDFYYSIRGLNKEIKKHSDAYKDWSDAVFAKLVNPENEVVDTISLGIDELMGLLEKETNGIEL